MDIKSAVVSLYGSFSFGNHILYNMCSDVNTDINNPDHLGDMIWLIGRAYAASPERRTYGYEKDKNGNLKKNTGHKWIPLWKAKNADDGKGDYFTNIAKYITTSPKFSEFKKIVDDSKNAAYIYDGSENDIALLCNGIYAVHLFNQLIREASEDYDELNDENNPDAVIAKKAKARCKNQISFCSKFLHFCCPNIVFIIDQCSYDGAKRLIPQKQLSYKPKFEKTSTAFEELDLVDLLSEYKQMLAAVKRVLTVQKNIYGLADSISKEDEKISSYIEHCVRAYCISQYLHNQQTKYVAPRLIDDLFLRIKKQ